MKQRIIILFSLFLLLCTNSYAQQSAKTQVNKKEKSTKPTNSKKKSSKKKKKEDENIGPIKQKPLPQKPTLLYKPIKKNGKVLTGNIKSIRGFRICLYSGSNREEALKIKRAYIKNYPGSTSYISYMRPYYRIKIGDFESKKIATKELKKLLPTYPSAFIVPDVVTIKQIHVGKNKARPVKKEKL
ncbi:MAG: SPOR domain-containing protein [Chitinophagaceae bacterium]